MKVNQQAIADFLGLDRTTVTKILNRDPKYSASEATKERVFRAAEILGYDFTTIRRPFKREYGRTELNSPAEMTITLEDGTVFDSGTAVVRNLSVGGALLKDINLPKQVLPLQNFTMLIKIKDIPKLAGLVGECEVVRLAGSSDTGEPELGVRFMNATHRDRRRIQDFVDKRIRVRQTERGGVGSSGEAAEGS
ncbi:MAG: PilZ domain-containing protein [Planctomycetota bacterium]|jgi:transcriptional regulator with XRE-family HTH domain